MTDTIKAAELAEKLDQYAEDEATRGRLMRVGNLRKAAALLRANAAVVPDLDVHDDVLRDITQPLQDEILSFGLEQSVLMRGMRKAIAAAVAQARDEAADAAAPSAPVLAEPQQPCQACINGEPTCKACGKCAQQPVQGGGDAVREAAKDLHNLTLGDATVIVRAPSAEKRDAIMVAGQRLRAALAIPPAQPDGQGDTQRAVPSDAIARLLDAAMDQAVANGANSISMPDEYVEIAAWLAGMPKQPTPQTLKDCDAGAWTEELATAWSSLAFDAIGCLANVEAGLRTAAECLRELQPRAAANREASRLALVNARAQPAPQALGVFASSEQIET